jgi:uncharacterized coiled-coil protein SlyX
MDLAQYENELNEEIEQLKEKMSKSESTIKKLNKRLKRESETTKQLAEQLAVLKNRLDNLTNDDSNLYLVFGLNDTNKRHLRKPIEFIEDAKGCFICTSHALDKNGYAKMRCNMRSVSIIRFIYSQCFGLIPGGWVVRHKCDNPSCINPEHLEVGTYLDNSRDMAERGRSYKGEKNNLSKLNEEEVINIKKRLEAGESPIRIAESYDVTYDNIYKIKKGLIWNHVRI